MAGKTNDGDDATKSDDLSRLQGKLNDLGMMFYTYLGILQRDAPPSNRTPEEADEATNDAEKRAELLAQTPTYARDIVRTSRDIEKIIGEIEVKFTAVAGKEHDLLTNANYESVQAGVEMTEVVDEASKLLTNMRDIIAAREGGAAD